MQERRKRRAIPRQKPPGRAWELCRDTPLAHTPAEHSSPGTSGVAEDSDSIRTVTAGSSSRLSRGCGTCKPRPTPSERGARTETPLLPPQPRDDQLPAPPPQSSRISLGEGPPTLGGAQRRGDTRATREYLVLPARPRHSPAGAAAGARFAALAAPLGSAPAPPGRSQPRPARPEPGRGGAAAGALPRRGPGVAATPRLLGVLGSASKCPGRGHTRGSPCPVHPGPAAQPGVPEPSAPFRSPPRHRDAS